MIGGVVGDEDFAVLGKAMSLAATSFGRDVDEGV
jgi:hypothetical protein